MTKIKCGTPREVYGVAVLIILAGLAVYAGSFSGVFLLDDHDLIVNNPYRAGISSRPLVDLTLALNYSLSGPGYAGYHAFNLLIHILSALVLYGILRRTFSGGLLQERYGRVSGWLAFFGAVLWMAHPLQTQAVNYTIQRSELLMGLFYFLALYSVIRAAESSSKGKWYAAALVSFVCGAASKESMVSVPLVILAYDRIFLARDWGRLVCERKTFYLTLFAVWLLLLAGLGFYFSNKTASAGFGFAGVTSLEYARTQPSVILHYLQLSLWPDPLVFDYDWRVAAWPQAVFLPVVAVAVLFMATLAALKFQPALGFAGLWFFLALALTSSVMPIADLAFENRMYLALAAVTVLFVVGIFEVTEYAGVRLGLASSSRQVGVAVIFLGLLLALGMVTHLRHEDYKSEYNMWKDTVEKRPENRRARTALGKILAQEGKYDLAQVQLREALRIDPEYSDAYHNLGSVFLRQEKLDQAAEQFNLALKFYSEDAWDTHYNLGIVSAQQGLMDEALAHYSAALALNPQGAEIFYNRGLLRMSREDLTAAGVDFKEALRIDPEYVHAYSGLGNVLVKQGKLKEAAVLYQAALKIDPGDPVASTNLKAIQQHLDKRNHEM